MDHNKLLLSLVFHREGGPPPPEQAGLLYQEEKTATHHLLLYGLQTQPQVLAMRPNFATGQRVYGKALTHKRRGILLGERKPFSPEKPMNAGWTPPKPVTAVKAQCPGIGKTRGSQPGLAQMRPNFAPDQDFTSHFLIHWRLLNFPLI